MKSGFLTVKLCRQFYQGFPHLITLPIVYAPRKQSPRVAMRVPIVDALRTGGEA